jgi:pyruvyl transferase EpsO
MTYAQSAGELTARHNALLEQAFAPHLPWGSDYALVDFPDHPNVGDSAIWAGQRVILRRLTGRDPVYVSTVSSYEQVLVDKLPKEAPLLIHGGGNLGDLWPKHQEFRARLIAENPDRPVIQLPQSIHFSDAASAESFARLLNKSPNFFLFVRDEKSRLFANEKLGIDAQLTPDSAVGMGLQRRPRGADHRAVLLLRTDHEAQIARGGPLNEIADGLIVDWLEEPIGFGGRTFKDARRQALTAFKLSRQKRRLLFFDLLARRRVDRGLALLSRGEVTVTDRLHAHILSVLLGLPTIALDNSYGKVSGYIDAWTAGYAGLRCAETPEQAAEMLSAPWEGHR